MKQFELFQAGNYTTRQDIVVKIVQADLVQVQGNAYVFYVAGELTLAVPFYAIRSGPLQCRVKVEVPTCSACGHSLEAQG